MSEDAYTLKELIQELRGETKEQSTVLTRICANLEGVEKHLSQLNSKVASHEKRFNGLENFQTKVMTAWGLGISAVTFFISHYL